MERCKHSNSWRAKGNVRGKRKKKMFVKGESKAEGGQSDKHNDKKNASHGIGLRKRKVADLRVNRNVSERGNNNLTTSASHEDRATGGASKTGSRKGQLTTPPNGDTKERKQHDS